MTNINLGLSGADPVALKEYVEHFGQKTTVKLAACVAVAQEVNWAGLAHSVLVPLARRYYDVKADAAHAVYQEACKPYLEAYEDERATAMVRHQERVEPSKAKYDEFHEKAHARLKSKDPRHTPISVKLELTKAWNEHNEVHAPSHSTYTGEWEAAWKMFTEKTAPAREALGVALATTFCEAANAELTALMAVA
jgi:hypothetical protein